MSPLDPGSPVWKDILLGKKEVQLEFLAAKIFLGTAQMKCQQDPSRVPELAKEFCALYQKYLALPAAQNDLKKIL